MYSRPEESVEDDPWNRNVTGQLGRGHAAEDEPAPWPPQDAEAVDLTDAYAALADVGLVYGPAFQGVGAVWRRGDDVFAEVRLPASHASEAGRFGLHPALFDAALHAPLLAAPADLGTVRVPFAWSGMSLHASGATELRVTVTSMGAGHGLADADRPVGPARGARGVTGHEGTPGRPGRHDGRHRTKGSAEPRMGRPRTSRRHR